MKRPKITLWQLHEKTSLLRSFAPQLLDMVSLDYSVNLSPYESLLLGRVKPMALNENAFQPHRSIGRWVDPCWKD